MNFTVVEFAGCYILPHLKGFRPEIFKFRKNVHPNIQTSIYSSIKHEHPLSLKDFLCFMIICEVCVYMYLSNAKSGGLLIQLTLCELCKCHESIMYANPPNHDST